MNEFNKTRVAQLAPHMIDVFGILKFHLKNLFFSANVQHVNSKNMHSTNPHDARGVSTRLIGGILCIFDNIYLQF